MSDAHGVAVWPPKYATGNALQMRYTNVQGLAFVLSCISMTGYLLGLGPFQNSVDTNGSKGQEGTMFALYVEVLLLIWRWVNELVHGECDLSGWLHHGALLIAVVLLEFHDQWKHEYCNLMVIMQILHYPMAFWYLGVRAYCMFSSAPARSLCVQLFRPSWWMCVGFRATSMLLSIYSALARWQAGGIFFLDADLTAAVLLATLFAVFLWLDMQWTKWFIRRVGKVCDGPLGDAFTFLSIVTGVLVARNLQV